MAANFLGLFFLIIGTAGISNAFSLKEIFHRNKRSYQIWPADLKSFGGLSGAFCRYKYAPFACRSIVHHPPYFRLLTDHENYPFLKNRFEEDQSFENPFHNVINDPHDPNLSSSEESISEHISDDTSEGHVNNEQNVSDYIRASAVMPSSGNSPQSNAYSKSITPATSSDGLNFVSDSYATRKKLSNFKFSPGYNEDSRVTDTTSNPEILHIIYRTPVEPQQRSSSFSKKENVDLIEVKNTFSTLENSSEGDTMESSKNNKDIESTSEYLTNIFRKNEGSDSSFIGKIEDRIDGLTTTSETKGFYPKKISSLQERLNKSLEKNLRTESGPIQNYTENYSITNRETRALADKSSSSDGTELIKSHVTITTDDGNSLKIKSSSSEGIYSLSTQDLDTGSDTSQSSFTMTHDDTTSQSRLSSSFETQPTTTKILEIESTTENSISLNKVTSIPFTDKVKEVTFSTESPSLKLHFTPEAITKDHIIEISSIRTARIVVTSVFLVIALTALTVLAVFMFRLRRREVEYDQLMLIT